MVDPGANAGPNSHKQAWVTPVGTPAGKPTCRQVYSTPPSQRTPGTLDHSDQEDSLAPGCLSRTSSFKPPSLLVTDLTEAESSFPNMK